MIGTLINVAAILLGGTIGLVGRTQLSATNQTFVKICLGIATVWVGLRLTWLSVNGPFLQILKQLGIVLLAMMLGKFTGRLLRLQRASNHLGRIARERIDRVASGKSRRWSDGFSTCALLYCAAPLGLLGSLAEGLVGYPGPLIIKAVMDALATMGFVACFGWSVLLAAMPVFAFQGTITLLAQLALPFLKQQGLLDSVNATGGLLIFCVALIIFDIKKVEIADYLPSLGYAALLTWLWN